MRHTLSKLALQTLIFALTPSLVACGKGDGGAPAKSGEQASAGAEPTGAAEGEPAAGLDAAAKDYVGIYEITKKTENEAGCDAEGEPTTPQDEKFFVVRRMNAGAMQNTINAMSCRDAEECKTKKTEGTTADFNHDFREVADGALVGSSTGSGYLDGANCKGAESQALRMVRDGDEVRFELRVTSAEYAANGQTCDTASASKAIEGKACSRLVVVRGKKVADL